MTLLPRTIVSLTPEGTSSVAGHFVRVDPRSSEGRKLSEAHWDDIVCANVEVLADALRVAGVLPEDSTLRLIARQFENVDVLLAEVPTDESGLPTEQGEPRRLVLLEDKLVRNPDAKRRVLAQVLDYADRSRQWNTDTLCRRVTPRDGTWLRAHAARVDMMLAQGELLLIIAGDDIDEDLLRLARRFAVGADPLSLTEMCLASLALYRRGEERLLIPHVVSAVERHQRQIAIRVTVKAPDGSALLAAVERDTETESATARRGALPTNSDVEAFLRRAKAKLDPLLGGLQGEAAVRKSIRYWFEDDAHVKIHFGGFVGDAWSPIQVGLYVESERRDEWHIRVEETQRLGLLPVGTKVRLSGAKTIEALKSVPWSVPAELNDALLDAVTSDLLAFVAAFSRSS